jgi:hypothetical protein
MIARFLCAAALVSVVACTASSAPEEGSTPVSTTAEGLTDHCRTVCPKCPANQICPYSPCYLDCTTKPTRCVETQLCIIGDVWDTKSCSCVPAP